MTYATVCTLILATAVQTIGSGPASVSIAATDDGYAVTYRNEIVSSQTVEPWAVDLDGFTVTGVIEAGDNEAPDDVVVSPPLGWRCQPCRVTVQEGQSGAVLLLPQVFS